jgi:Predicted membrane protein (DUF2339)
MELVVAILIVGIVLLWFRTSSLARRLEDIELRALALQQREDTLRADVDERGIGPARDPHPTAGVPSTAVTAPVAAPAPVVAWETSAPAPAVAHPAPATAPAQNPSRPAWTYPRRPGPGLVYQTLLKLGLTPPAGGEGFSPSAIVAWLEGRMLAAVGGVALVLAAVFFLSLAFSRGWITEPMRVLIGLGAGIGLLVLGELALSKLRGIVGPVLVAVGLAVVSLALIAATRLFGLVPVEWGLVGAFLAAVAAAIIAIRHDSQLVAGFGLIAVLAAPPVLGASPTLVTVAFVAVTLIGTTGVALFRTWAWLPSLAYVLAAPQLASYVSGGPPTADALIAIAGFWLVNTIAAGGEEIRHATDRLRTTSVTLVLASAAFTVWAGFTVLSGPEAQWRGSFLAVMAIAHLGLGLFFMVRDGDRNPFGLVVGATGIAALTMAVPIQFGGPPVPIAWAAEAVALTWVAVRRRHPYSAGLAIVLGVLALAHLLLIEYPPATVGSGFDRAWPFVGPEGLTFGFMLGALIVAGLAVPIAWVRGVLAVVAGLITSYVLPAELSGPGLVAAWAALAAVAAWVLVRVVSPRLGGDFEEDRVAGLALPEWIEAFVKPGVATLSRLVVPGFVAVAAIAGIATLGHLVTIDFPILRLGAGTLSSLPYIGMEGLSLAAVLVALAAAAWLISSRPLRLGVAGIALALLVYSVTFEIDAPNVMVAWAILGLAAVAVVRRIALVQPIPTRRRIDAVGLAERLPFAAATLALLSLVVQALSYAGLDAFGRHLVGDLGPAPSPFLDVRSYALVIIVITAVVAGWTWRGTTALLVGGLGAALAIAWLLPFEIRTGYAVAGWAALAFIGVSLIRRVPEARRLVGLPSIALAAVGALVTIAVVAPPDRLVVDATTIVVGWPLFTDATVALGALAVAIGAGAYLHRTDPLSRPAFIATGVIAVYLLSVGLVDVFQRQVGTASLDDLQKESQVGLSVLWSVLGGIWFASGLRTGRPPIRLAGLALLGLATVKVFLVDLAALDVAYRVLSLVALGVLLLGSAFVYSRVQRPPPPGTPKPA